MSHEVPCNLVSDLLPLYVEGLTSDDTNSFIQKHMEECPVCQNEYQAFKAGLSNSAQKENASKTREVDYLKKIHLYQNINLVLGAIVSFLFGACIPVLKVGIPVLLNGSIPEYYLARLQIAWHIGLLKMALSGIVVCGLYLLIMFFVRKKVK